MPPPIEPVHAMRHDIFKEKYSMHLKHKKMPSLDLKYKLREQVRNIKSDLLKIEPVDLSKTRWPMNKRNMASTHKTRSEMEKRAPTDKSNHYMLPTNEYAAYLLKYFKRDIAKSLNSDDEGVKAIYLFENVDSSTENNSTVTAISLETLIDNLIKNRFNTTLHAAKNVTKSNTVADERKRKENTTKVVTERTGYVVNKTNLANETVNIISISPSTNKFNEMIINLSKRIEKQNNTSIEIAKRVVGYVNEEDAHFFTNTTTLKNDEDFTKNRTMKIEEKYTFNQETKSTTSADFKKTMPTKKNRQRISQKLHNSKSNSQ